MQQRSASPMECIGSVRFGELGRLYLRRRCIEDLIQALETYDRCRRSQARKLDRRDDSVSPLNIARFKQRPPSCF